MAEHHYKFHIKMTCSGCSGAIERVLGRMEGLSSYSVSLEGQTADIYTASVEYGALLAKIKNTGKTVLGAERDGVGLEV